MLKTLLIITFFLPIVTFADVSLDISLCANNKDNFARLACFDKLANTHKNLKKILRVQASTRDIASASIYEIENSLGSLKSAQFTEALRVLAYANLDFPLDPFQLEIMTHEFLTTIDNKTIDEILELASESKTINISTKNKAKYLKASNLKISEEKAKSDKLEAEALNLAKKKEEYHRKWKEAQEKMKTE